MSKLAMPSGPLVTTAYEYFIPPKVLASNTRSCKYLRQVQDDAIMDTMRLSEKAFQSQIIQLAEMYGWMVYHVPDSRRVTCRGYPDLTLLHPSGLLLVREVKVGRRKLTREQTTWLEGMRACGVDTGVWRPRDWEEIVATLATNV